LKNSENWLVCCQTTYDCVKYHTINGDTKYPQYYDFLNLMMFYNIKDPFKFKKTLDTFKIIYIDLMTGEWSILNQEKAKVNDFEKLVELNQNEEEERLKKDKMLSMVTKGKNFLKKPIVSIIDKVKKNGRNKNNI